MKRFALLLVLCGLLCAARSFAQDHFLVGAYVDYFHLSRQTAILPEWARAPDLG